MSRLLFGPWLPPTPEDAGRPSGSPVKPQHPFPPPALPLQSYKTEPPCDEVPFEGVAIKASCIFPRSGFPFPLNVPSFLHPPAPSRDVDYPWPSAWVIGPQVLLQFFGHEAGGMPPSTPFCYAGMVLHFMLCPVAGFFPSWRTQVFVKKFCRTWL